MMETGIYFALKNIQKGRTAGWAAGTEADHIPFNQRNAFNAGVRLVEDLSFSQQLAARHLLNGSANVGDARQLPAEIVTVLRRRDSNLDYVLSLLESGKATVSLPPYED